MTTIISLLLLGFMGTPGFASLDPPSRLPPDAEEHPFRRLGKPYVGRELKWQHEHPHYPRHLTEANMETYVASLLLCEVVKTRHRL